MDATFYAMMRGDAQMSDFIDRVVQIVVVSAVVSWLTVQLSTLLRNILVLAFRFTAQGVGFKTVNVSCSYLDVD